MSWADSFSRALFLTPFTERGGPCSPLNSRSFRFQTHGRKGQGAEGCGQGPGGRVSIAATRTEAGHADHFWAVALALRDAAQAPASVAFTAMSDLRPKIASFGLGRASRGVPW